MISRQIEKPGSKDLDLNPLLSLTYTVYFRYLGPGHGKHEIGLEIGTQYTTCVTKVPLNYGNFVLKIFRFINCQQI